MNRTLGLAGWMLAALVSCSDSSEGVAGSDAGQGASGTGGNIGGNGGGGAGTGGNAAGAGAGAAADSGLGPGDIVWLDTPVIEHDKDYHDVSEYLNPAVPKNWVTPINYADGDVTIHIELVEVADAASTPIYYLVGWGPGDGTDGYIRGGAMFEQSTGVSDERVPVKTFQKVVNGVDSGNVGSDWNWQNAFGTVNTDAWGAGGTPYPLKARIRLTLHPKS